MIHNYYYCNIYLDQVKQTHIEIRSQDRGSNSQILGRIILVHAGILIRSTVSKI
jgi:hypothetical protein